MSFVYQLGLHYIPLIYANLLLTLGAGFLLGVLIGIVIKQGKIRNTGIALLSLMLLVVAFLGSKFFFQYQRAKSEFANLTQQDIFEQIGQKPTDEQLKELKQTLLQEYTIMDHIQNRVETGWQVGRAGRGGKGGVSGVMVYIVWLIELGAILFISGNVAASAARNPFSEKLNAWADESEIVMNLPVTSQEMVDKIKSATSVQELLEIPLPKSDQSDQFAVYTVNSIPGNEMEDAYLTVELQTHSVNKKGEKEVKKSTLVNNAILTSAQRTHLADNVKIMNEAFQAYYDSLQKQPETT